MHIADLISIKWLVENGNILAILIFTTLKESQKCETKALAKKTVIWYKSEMAMIYT